MFVSFYSYIGEIKPTKLISTDVFQEFLVKEYLPTKENWTKWQFII